MATEVRPAHSPLGASSAERWMNCPGSVALIKKVGYTAPSDEPEYRSLGTSAHKLADHCLNTNTDAWEHMGQPFGKHKVDQEMSTNVQIYLDECRAIVEPGSRIYTEFRIDAPDFHPDFYGTLDRGVVTGPLLRIRDFKYGAGIAVDIERNPQLMYYAYGLLRHHPEVEDVEIGIVQPRGFHSDGPIRLWRVPAKFIRDWADNELKPAMERVSLDNDLLAGPHCRFCPAKLVCPLMRSLFGAAMQANPAEIIALSDDNLGRSYPFIAAVKHYIKAMEEETLNRLMAGHKFGTAKLVNKKADRVWKEGSEEHFRMLFGLDALSKPALLSPSQLEKLSNSAKAEVKKWAYTPQAGLTVAPMDDKRSEVVIRSPNETFSEYVDKANET